MKLTNKILDKILDDVRPLIGQGKVADYIPALAKVSPEKLAMAIYTTNGELFYSGDALDEFSIQSISKVLNLTLAMQLYDADEIWSRVKKEPSGHAFNSMIQLEVEHGMPRNPFINAGAIVICDLLYSRLASPGQSVLDFARRLCNDPHVFYDISVAQSEMKHGDRNAAIAHLMRSFGNFHNQVQPVLDNYFHGCSLRMSCVQLAKTFSYLANQGVVVETQERILSPIQNRQINALLATCGLYDEAGEFAYRVGMPGKSGVGGGIIAIVPDEMTIAVWSPELNPAGNSLAGGKALELFAQRIGRSVF